MGRARTLMAAVGTTFLVAAALKAWAVLTAPTTPPGWFATPVVQIGIVQIEVLLGLWLCSGKLPRAACALSVIVFLCFAGINLYQGWIGLSSCGCFGRLRVNPWYALTLDLAAVTALAVALKASRAHATQRATLAAQLRQALYQVAVIAGGAALLLTVLTGGAIASFGSLHGAVAYLRGDRLLVEPAEVDAGVAEPHASRLMAIELRNWSDHPVTFLGGVNDCACWVTRDLPVEIPAGESRSVTIQVNYPPSPGRFRRAIDLITNDGRETSVRFLITGTCVGPEAERQPQQSAQP